MEEKIYIGTGKLIEFTGGGEMLKMSFNREDIAKMNDNLDAAGWVRINIKKRREPSAKGQTHYGQVDTWSPDRRVSENNNGGVIDDQPAIQPEQQRAAKHAAEQSEYLPF